MIQYALKCDNEHSFDSWFQSAEAFEKLSKADMLTCPTCGSEQIDKAVMAPRVKKSEKGQTKAPSLKTLSHPEEQAIKKLKTFVENNSDYVGKDFATQARDMHEGITPERSIYGEARPEDAKKLIEDGIPVTPLPFTLARKSN